MNRVAFLIERPRVLTLVPGDAWAPSLRKFFGQDVKLFAVKGFSLVLHRSTELRQGKYEMF